MIDLYNYGFLTTQILIRVRFLPLSLGSPGVLSLWSSCAHCGPNSIRLELKKVTDSKAMIDIAVDGDSFTETVVLDAFDRFGERKGSEIELQRPQP